jgi:hypothetical protein
MLMTEARLWGASGRLDGQLEHKSGARSSGKPTERSGGMKRLTIFVTNLSLIVGIICQTPKDISNYGTIFEAKARAAEPRADLKIIKVSFPANSVLVIVKNIGDAPSTYCNLKVSFLQGKDADSKVAQSWNKPVPAIPQNKQVSLTVDIGKKSFPGKGCLVTVDTQNTVVESDKNNNQYFTNALEAFTVQADLAAIKVYADFPTNQVTATIKNVGGAKYTGSRQAILYCITTFSSHQKQDTLQTDTVPALNPGQTFTLKSAMPKYKGAVKYTWIIRIDEGDINPNNDSAKSVSKKVDHH